jgi:acyl carrier protein
MPYMHTDVLALMRKSVADVLGMDEGSVSMREPLVVIGMDSLGMLDLVFRIERLLGVSLSIDQLPIETLTVQALADMLAAAQTRSALSSSEGER